MRKYFKSLVTVIFFSISLNSYAAIMIGGGVNSCSHFLETTQSNSRLSDMWGQWISGFISGMNYERNESKGKNIDEKDFVGEVRNYCQREPLKKVYDAVIWIYESKL